MYPLTPVYIYSDPVNGRSGYKQTCFGAKPHRSGVAFAFATNSDVSTYPSLYIQWPCKWEKWIQVNLLLSQITKARGWFCICYQFRCIHLPQFIYTVAL